MPGPQESNYTIGVGAARQPASLSKVIQVGDRLAHTEHRLMCIECSLKQGLDLPGSALRTIFTSPLKGAHPIFMVRAQLLDPHPNPGEGQPVRR